MICIIRIVSCRINVLGVLPTPDCGLKPYQKVAFTIEDNQVSLRPARFTLETAYQSVPPLKQPLSDEEMSRIAKEERAERAMRKLAAE